MQQFGSNMDPEHASVMFSEFVPKATEEEIVKQNITTFHAALDFVEETLSRLNGDRLAEFEEKRIQMTMQGKPTMPFIDSLTGDAAPTQQTENNFTQDIMQQFVAAMQASSGRRAPPRTTPSIPAARSSLF